MNKPILLAILFIIFSCDDPSLENMGNTDDGIIEPRIELTQLSSIKIASASPTNIIDSYDFEYDNLDLLESINSSVPLMQNVLCFYTNANRLQRLAINNSGVSSNTIISNGISSNGDSFISLTFNDYMNNLIEKRLFTDAQNRIKRALTTSTDATGTSSFVSDYRLEYTQNFNVTRINQVDQNGVITAFTDFTYNFNNNPFKDMDDIIRFELFDDFNPYSRNLPATREDFTVSNTNGASLERSIQYTYKLNAKGFPIERESLVTEMGMTSTFFEFFNYRP